jgi:hypothetical protein
MIELGNDLNFAMIGENLILGRVDGESIQAFRARARHTALNLGSAVVVWVDEPPGRSVVDQLMSDAPFYHYDDAPETDALIKIEDGSLMRGYRARVRVKAFSFGGGPDA